MATLLVVESFSQLSARNMGGESNYVLVRAVARRGEERPRSIHVIAAIIARSASLSSMNPPQDPGRCPYAQNDSAGDCPLRLRPGARGRAAQRYGSRCAGTRTLGETTRWGSNAATGPAWANRCAGFTSGKGSAPSWIACWRGTSGSASPRPGAPRAVVYGEISREPPAAPVVFRFRHRRTRRTALANAMAAGNRSRMATATTRCDDLATENSTKGTVVGGPRFRHDDPPIRSNRFAQPLMRRTLGTSPRAQALRARSAAEQLVIRAHGAGRFIMAATARLTAAVRRRPRGRRGKNGCPEVDAQFARDAAMRDAVNESRAARGGGDFAGRRRLAGRVGAEGVSMIRDPLACSSRATAMKGWTTRRGARDFR